MEKKSTGKEKEKCQQILIQKTVSDNLKVQHSYIEKKTTLNFIAHLSVQYICFQRSKNRRLKGFGRKKDILDSEIQTFPKKSAE